MTTKISKTRVSRTVLSWLLIAFFLFTAGAEVYSLTSAGTRISNKAIATFQHNGQTYSTESNSVWTDVAPIYGLSITPDGSLSSPTVLTSVISHTVYFPYILTNIGNTTDRFTLNLESGSGGTFVPLGTKIILDGNGNGIADTGEPEIIQTGAIPQDGFVHLIVVYSVPVTAHDGDFALVNLVGTSSGDVSKVDSDNWNKTVVSSAAYISITKSASPAIVQQGGTINYSVSISNNSGNPSTPRVISTLDLDGDLTTVVVSGILIEDAIPAGTGVSGNPSIDFSASYPSGSQRLYGYANGNWSSSGTAPGWGAIVKVGLYLSGSLESGQSSTFGWTAHVSSSVYVGNIKNQAIVDWADSIADRDSLSNITITEVIPSRGILIGPLNSPDASGTGSYRTPDPVTGPFDITYSADLSIAEFADEGLWIAFTNTIRNSGTASDTFNISSEWTTNALSGSLVRYYAPDGIIPLVDTNADSIPDTGPLVAGEDRNLVVKVWVPLGTAMDALNHDVEVTARSIANPFISDTTTDRIRLDVRMWNPVVKQVSPSGDVAPGTTLHFTISFGNVKNIDAYDVDIEDVLASSLVNPVNITNGTLTGTVGGSPVTIPVSGVFTPLIPTGSTGTLSWVFPMVPAGFSGTVAFDVSVAANLPDGTSINNISSIVGRGLPVATTNVTLNTIVRQNLLIVEKHGNKSTAEVGDFLKYTVAIKNTSTTMPVGAPVAVVDQLPPGFRYVTGSSRLDGVTIADPAVTNFGMTLSWPNVGVIPPLGTKTLDYVVTLSTETKAGDKYNSVTATGHSTSGGVMTSNEARALVKVTEGVFGDGQTILGRVFIDVNGNGLADAGEVGVPGIRLYMEDGTYVVTDSEGKYHFESIKAKLHVVKVDPVSIPAGVTIRASGNRTAGDSDSIFVDLRKGELFKANFMAVFYGFESSAIEFSIAPAKDAQLSPESWKKIRMVAYFKPGTDELSEMSIRQLEAVFGPLSTASGIGKIRMALIGETANPGTVWTHEKNTELLSARMNKVADYLITTYRIKIESIELARVIDAVPAPQPEPSPEGKAADATPGTRVRIDALIPLSTQIDAGYPGEPETKVTTMFRNAMGGPLTGVYVLIRTDDPKGVIRPKNLSINGQVNSDFFFFDGFWWVRVKDADRSFDTKSYDNDRVSIQQGSFEQLETSTVAYTLPPEQVPSHFIVGVDPLDGIKVFAEAALGISALEKAAVYDKIIELYGMIHPVAIKKPAPPVVVAEPLPFGIISPKDGSVFWTRDKVTVKVRAPYDAEILVKINDTSIPDTLIGKKYIDKASGYTELEFVGVPLARGINVFELATKNGAGAAVTDKVSLILADNPTKIDVKTLPGLLIADGKTEPQVQVKVTDVNNVPLPDGAFITVWIDKGRLLTPDANPQKDGYQIVVRNGVAEFMMTSFDKPVDVRLKITVGNLEAEKKLEFLPYLRDWIFIALAEGTVGYNFVIDNVGGGADAEEGFYLDGDVSLFAKGTILGKYLLTMAVDSTVDSEQSRFFQQVQPDKEYIVYGDATVQNYDAESSGRIYIKLEKDKSYAMYGDYRTDFVDTQIARYDRTFTGVKSAIETKIFDMKAFWTRTDRTMIRDEIRGIGISGYYTLTHKPVIENSEKIRVEVRDSHSPDIVVSYKDMVRYVDYWLDYQTGNIMFREPVRSTDSDMNPVYISAVYETDDGAVANDVFGVRPKLKLFGGKLAIGATGVLERGSIQNNIMAGVDISGRLDDHLSATAELAWSDMFDGSAMVAHQGFSKLVSLTADYGKTFKATAKYLDSDSEFRNPNTSAFSSAVTEFSLNAESEYFKNVNLKMGAIYRENQLTTDRVGTVGLDGKLRLTDWLSVSVGGRFVDSQTSTLHQNAWLVNGGLYADITKKMKLFVRREQVVAGDRLDGTGFASNTFSFATYTGTGGNSTSGSAVPGSLLNGEGYPDKTTAGFDYQLTDRTKLTAGYEWLDGTALDVNRIMFGVVSQVLPGTSVYGNYGTELYSVDKPKNLAVFGAKSQIKINEGNSLDLGLERLQTVTGVDTDDFTAALFGYSHIDDLNKLAAKWEIRFGKVDVRNLIDLSASTKSSRDLTWIVSNRFSYIKFTEKPDEYLNDLVFGVAYRPMQFDRLNLLSKVRMTADQVSSGDTSFKLIGAVEGNYQLLPNWTLSGKYALKWQSDVIDEVSRSSFTDLVSTKVNINVTEDWDLGGFGGVLHQWDSKTFDYYWGMEAGLKIVQNLWGVVGFNFKGLGDLVFDDNTYLKGGLYFTLRCKLDEKVFAEGKKNAGK